MNEKIQIYVADPLKQQDSIVLDWNKFLFQAAESLIL